MIEIQHRQYTRIFFLKLEFSSAHADIKETFKQKRANWIKIWQVLQVSLPFSKSTIDDKSAYKIENQFLANNFVPQ